MRVVVDTNIILVAVSRRSPYNWVFQKLKNGEFKLCVSTEILGEYAEVIERHMGAEVSQVVLQAITELPNVEKVEVFYRWQLVRDPDDNKFTDCAIAARAKCLVTNDSDFRALEEIDFPKVTILSLKEFKEHLENH